MKSEETGNVCEEGEKRGDSKYHLREPPTPPRIYRREFRRLEDFGIKEKNTSSKENGFKEDFPRTEFRSFIRVDDGS
ncbi:hypothetical protein TNCV_994391 [Trichonephila clavipes]|nr:hypothetical protein TNCV_994391 [Trichonephila clavipes]